MYKHGKITKFHIANNAFLAFLGRPGPLRSPNGTVLASGLKEYKLFLTANPTTCLHKYFF
jgi:hypothetical protein